MSRAFYELCYDLYKREMDEATSYYQKAGVLLGVIPLIGASIVAQLRLDVVNLISQRVDVVLYFLGVLLAAGALSASVVYLFFCVFPRQYRTLANMDVWQQWFEEYEDYLQKLGDGTVDSEKLDSALFQNVCPRLAEAQPINAKINQKRHGAFATSIRMAAIAIAATGVQTFFGVVLRVRGI